MSTPALPPRHLPHRGTGSAARLFGGRQTARIRAIVAADLLPPERAATDALVLTAWLTAAQRARYAVSLRCGDHPEDFVQALADERRVVLEEGADPVADELDSAAQAERDARQLPLRVLETLLLLVALGVLVTFVVRDVLSGGGLSSGGAQPGLSAAAVVVGAVLLAAVVGTLATRRRDRRLLDWAVARPGQLGRGLPVRRPLQSESAGPAVVQALGPALLVAGGILAIVAGAAILLLTLMLGDERGMAAGAPWSLGAGVLSLLVAVLAGHLRGRRLVRRVRRARAAEWLGATAP